MDRGAWWAAVHGVVQSRTRLKRLSSSSSKKPYVCSIFEVFWYNFVSCSPPRFPGRRKSRCFFCTRVLKCIWGASALTSIPWFQPHRWVESIPLPIFLCLLSSPSPGVVLIASLWDGKPPYVTVYLIPCSTVHLHKCQTLILQHWLLENTQTSLLSKNLTPHTKTLQMEITAVVFDVHLESLSWKPGTKSHLYSSARYCKAPCVTGIELCPKRGLVFALGSWGAYL